MDKFLKVFFSMKMMTIGLIVFLVAIGAATFFESIYDIQTARLLIYNALWFEVLLIYLGIGLIINIFEQRMFRREKASTLAFHFAFIFILIGAWVTRYMSYDGLMIIREGTESNFIYSSDPYLWFRINDGKLQYTADRKAFMSEVTNNDFEIDLEFPNHKSEIKIEYVDFQKKVVDSLVINDTIQSTLLDIKTDGMKSNYLGDNGFVMVGDVAISMNKRDAMPGVHISLDDDKYMIKSDVAFKYLPMAEMQKARQSGEGVSEEKYVYINKDSLVEFKTTTLYIVNNQQFVFKQTLPNAKVMKLPSGSKNRGSDYLTVKVSDGNESKIVELEGGMAAIPTNTVFTLNGLTYEMQYGSKKIDLPFSIACNDFQLEKYPGSEAPSSFASEVTVVDSELNHQHQQRIFMNNVMDYRGYRFFQSSYDLDNPQTPENEEGTRLSVNHDWWGTNISYLGYLLMSVGMIMALFAKASRFRELNEKLKKLSERKANMLGSLLLPLILLLSFNSRAEEGHNHEHHSVSPQKDYYQVMIEAHSESLSTLLVQDYNGRIVPLHTVADQILRKVYRSNKYKDYNPVQVVMSMHMYPQYWMKQNIIYVSSNLRERFKVEKYASYTDLSDENGDFKWMSDYQKAHQKLEKFRDEFDKKLIKLVEKFQVLQAVFSWQYMKIIPLKGESNNSWFVPLSMNLVQKDSTSSVKALQYLSALDKACRENKYGEAEDLLNGLKEFQREEGEEVVPSESKINIEVSYNKMQIFKNTWYSYLTFGFILLIIYFIRIFVRPTGQIEKRFKVISRTFLFFLIVTFVYHAVGLSFRWFITGHAPWSNGYGAIVFIAWVTMLAGFIFAKKNPVIIASTAILAALMIFVSELNLMDPEITPIQPVLKSYWLMIHVAIITGSYGFLGLGCILSILNLILYIFRNKKNGSFVSLNISELTYVAEMTTTVGIFMLTIGTFLGGIWANESWGRYWAWDPKEVWALVSVLVYAVLLHLRYVPGLGGKFLFNSVSMWSYSAIIFTFFGVNFYLVGLHSYAQGEGLGKIPNGLYIAVGVFILLNVVAAIRNKKYKKLSHE